MEHTIGTFNATFEIEGAGQEPFYPVDGSRPTHFLLVDFSFKEDKFKLFEAMKKGIVEAGWSFQNPLSRVFYRTCPLLVNDQDIKNDTHTKLEASLLKKYRPEQYTIRLFMCRIIAI